jgi:hypothetical protein
MQEERLMEMKKILSLFLSLFLLLPPAYGNTPNGIENTSGFNVITAEYNPNIILDPSGFELKLGDLDITAYYLMPGSPSLIYGIMVDKDTFEKIEYIMNNQGLWCQGRLDAERKLFDKTLEERDEACRKLNADLIEDKDNLTEKLKITEISLQKEERFSKLLMWTGGTTILALTGTLIFLNFKK